MVFFCLSFYTNTTQSVMCFRFKKPSYSIYSNGFYLTFFRLSSSVSRSSPFLLPFFFHFPLFVLSDTTLFSVAFISSAKNGSLKSTSGGSSSSLNGSADWLRKQTTTSLKHSRSNNARSRFIT